MKAPIGYPLGNRQMYLDRVRMHREADTLIRGIGYQGNGEGRGCAIGCTLHSYDHAEYERQIGVPQQVARLVDWLFENLRSGHLEWPERVLSAIREGADLTPVYPQWQVRLQQRNLARVGEGTEPWRTAVRKAIEDVVALWAKGWPTEAAAWSAESARNAALRSRSAAESAAESAAWSARRTTSSSYSKRHGW